MNGKQTIRRIKLIRGSKVRHSAKSVTFYRSLNNIVVLFASKNLNGTYTQESDTLLNDLTTASRIRRQGGFKTLPRSSIVFDRGRKRYLEEDVGMEEDPCCHLPAMTGKGKNRKSIAMSDSLTPPTSAPEWRSHFTVHEMRKRPYLVETLQQLSPGIEDECDRNRRMTEGSQLHMIGQLRRKRSFFLT